MFRVLFSIVVSMNVLNCKMDDKIDLSLSKKEADFVLDVFLVLRGGGKWKIHFIHEGFHSKQKKV